MRRVITEEIKKAIVEAKTAGMRVCDIAKKFNVDNSQVSKICIAAGLRTQRKRETNERTCPKCHRGPFPKEYTYCPYCAIDIRSEREHVIESLLRAKDRLRLPYDDADSAIHFAIMKAVKYLENEGNE